MGAIFGAHSTLWILLIWSLEFSPSNVCNGLLEVYEKECQGTEMGFSFEHKPADTRYEDYRKQYENCTLIRDNLEIIFIQVTDAQYDFSFLETIREVNGYVLIYGNYVNRIRLNGLRVIRGWKTYIKTVNETKRKLSLYVGWNHNHEHDSIGLRELQLTSLVEITQGDVFFDNNAQLCFGEKTINWSYIRQNNPKGEIMFTSTEKKRVCDKNCHENCTLGNDKFCWGEGPDMCQAERPCKECRRKCSGIGCFCSSDCIGGCTGSDEATCVACKTFLKGDRCVDKCNKMIYNQDKSEWEYPPPTYMLGSKCVETCPDNMLIQQDACVTKCMTGFMENKTSNERTCVLCKDSVCPKTCSGTEPWLHGNHLADFNQCTKVNGNLKINNNSFKDHVGPGIQLTDLEILKDIEEITGMLSIDAWHPNLTSLPFLRKLRVIGGIGAGSYSLIIRTTRLMTMDLNSVRQIKQGGVYIAKNDALCYAYTINWTGILTSKANEKIIIKNNTNSSICEEQGLTCSELCSDLGCWGPGDDNCVSCRNYSIKGTCVTNCSMEHGFYSYTTEDGILECGKCHEECLLGCSGDGPNNCKSCRHVRDNEVCRSECPENRYSDLTGTCQWCDGTCKNCTGNSSRLGPFGCNNCEQGLLLIKSESEKYCLKNATECDETHYWSHEHVNTPILKEPVSMRTCRKCHPECNGCRNGNKATDCIKCRNYNQTDSEIPDKFDCVSNCSYDNGYYYVGNNMCMPCAAECKHCNGPTKYDYDCSLCADNYFRITVISNNDGTEKDLGNNTSYQSYCDKRCPPEQPNIQQKENDTESHCSVPLKSENPLEATLGASISVVFFVVIAVGIIIFVVFWRQQKLRRLREGVLANDEIPMISSSKAKPDMSLLRLIKESELRRGNMIGSGAFGTVYKGIWIPEKENIKIPVAIKVLTESSNTSQNVELLDEARIMASVCNPYCVRILAVCMTAEMMLITQLMPLGCLLDYVRKEKSNIGSRALLLWSVQIAKGMKYLEDVGIVHRDLAARNVLVHNPNQVKITDFGLAKLLDYEEEEIHSEGGKMPIKWLALECIQHRIYTHKSDVWSYGVTLWEMFTYGERPYENLAARQIPQALEKGERLPQPYICTIDVYMIMIKCWMLDVDSRPTFSDLTDEFTRMAQDPGRFLVIPGDKLMRLPSNAPDTKDLVRLMSLPIDEPDLMVVSGEEYLRPMDMDSSGDSSYYPPTTSPLGPLTSIPEDDAYENTRPISKSEEEDESPSRNGKIEFQYSREPSQRYCTDPCRSEPGRTSDPQKKGNAVGKTIRLDEDGYLPPQSTTTPPSYLEVVNSENDSTDSQAKQTPLDNQQQQYLDMRPSFGLAKDNPEYYEEDTKHLTTSGSTGSNKLGAPNASEKSNQNGSEYCNVPSTPGKLVPPYARLPETDV